MNVAGGGTQSANWGSGIDNLSFDNVGNLWAQQDGGNGHIWVIRPDHTPFAPKIDIYATTPSGSESSGLTFTPDYRFGFLSIMGASGSNTTSALDAAGTPVVFNTSNTLIIANKKFLGSLAAVPVEFYEFKVSRKGEDAAYIYWSTATELNNEKFLVERSTDGITYKTIATVAGAGNSVSVQNYTMLDPSLEPRTYYYRIKQVDFDGKYSYSVVRILNLNSNLVAQPEIYPVPFNGDLKVKMELDTESETELKILDLNGKTVLRKLFEGTKGTNIFNLNTTQLTYGVYFLEVSNGGNVYSEKIVK
jgi:hypothetical protein